MTDATSFQTGDWSFVDELEALLPQMRAFARSLCHDPVLADDIVQSACLSAWGAADSFDRTAKMRPWILRIVRNEYLQHCRRAWRNVDVESGFLEEMLVDHSSAEMMSEASHAVQAIYSLPVKQRDAVILVLAAGLTYEEAGLVLNCSPGTVKSRVNRARSVLVDELNGITQMITLAQSGQMDATNLNALIVQAETLMARAA
ncbi:sigma-70 family RNA polymerase sigma factor [Hyphomonas sp.]|uniref:RNA polymerase sigma factor n=1 Tax=Hyphomonas sp. TaxID=87 RepID=UPI0025C57392|nr:sigma-70 family RNA polymerase sigma factor [Hyphomonas sp.]